MHFRSHEDLIRFLRTKPEEPKRYEEPKEEPAERKEDAEDGEVLQAD